MKVDLHNLRKSWGEVDGVFDVSLDIKDGEFVALLGPSGCGKTTTLLMVAGIYRPTEGEICFDDHPVSHLPPKDRNLGMVFQSYALYPHMTVKQNIAYPLKLQKASRQVIDADVSRIAELLGIGELLQRKPGELSGGQQQRVALGRALAKAPALLLFDEPLSNLDARLRLVMRSEIRRLQQDLGVTALYVTHDQVEALTMADRIAVYDEGTIRAYDTAGRLYDTPPNRFVAGFIGNPPMNFLKMKLAIHGDDVQGNADGLSLALGAAPNCRAAATQGEVEVGLRPEAVTLGGDLPASVFGVEPLGRETMVEVAVGEHRLRLLAAAGFRAAVGEPINIRIDGAQAHFFDQVSGDAIR